MLVSVFDKDANGSAATLGGKGYGLWWMQQQGINVPPALIIPTSVCVDYTADPAKTMAKIAKRIKDVQMFFLKEFDYLPLLSIRSGARVSMPGMMDTILNVGLDNSTLPSWEQRIGSDCAVDSFKRLVTMYGNVVDGIDRKELEHGTLPEALALYERKTGKPFPTGDAQILGAIEAVFKSWNNERAKVYRKMNDIPEDWGTAVVIQSMVFGNMNENSGTGVLFTRDPDSGENSIVGEFLVNAQGEDVVAGIRTPMKLSALSNWNAAVSKELMETVTKLEVLKGDVQDVEFTIQDGKLYLLQTRTAKRSAPAAVKIALDMMDEGVLTKEQALDRVSERDLDLADQPVIDPKFKTKADFTGIPACSGIQTGIVCLTSKTAVQMAAAGKKVILVSEETTPDDIAGMAAAVGVLTMTGGSTSHAAVVARSMNRTCVVGLGAEYHGKFSSGQQISIDGATGRVWLSAVPVVGGANPLVERMRKLRLGPVKLLVESAPKFSVDELVLELKNILHFDDTALMVTLKECLSRCKVLHLSCGVDGVSRVFYTDPDHDARLQQVAKLLATMVSYQFTTYGFSFASNPVTLMGVMPKLEELVMVKSSMLVQSIAEPTPAEKRVLAWLSADGIFFDVWNSKTSTGPKSYSVAVS